MNFGDMLVKVQKNGQIELLPNFDEPTGTVQNLNILSEEKGDDFFDYLSLNQRKSMELKHKNNNNNLNQNNDHEFGSNHFSQKFELSVSPSEEAMIPSTIRKNVGIEIT